MICGTGSSAGPTREPGNDAGVRRSRQADQHGDGVCSLLVGRAKERHHPAPGSRALVPTWHMADADSCRGAFRENKPIRFVIRCWHAAGPLVS